MYNLVKSSHSSTPTLPISSILARDKSHLVSPPTGEPYLLPFQNVKTRATVRVVDYFPEDLADFSSPITNTSEFDGLPVVERDGPSDIDDISLSATCDSLAKWEWRFSLILEDASNSQRAGQKPRLKVYVVGADADFLLKLDATDLRSDPQSLDELKEKLFLLWGDLEEQKSAAIDVTEDDTGRSGDQSLERSPRVPQGRPFECCLMEYGTRVSSENGHGGDIQESIEVGNGEANQTVGEDWERRWRLFGTTII